MTLTQLITRVLSRTGLSISASDHQDRARDYINQMLAEITPMVPWWWLSRNTTFATVASTRTYRPVSGNVTAWFSFVDETSNRTLEIIGNDAYNSVDPDRSESGSPRAVLITGLDLSNSGFPSVDIFPLPDSVKTIRVQYRADIDEFTSSDDPSDLLALGVPRIVESILEYGAVALYLEENGDDSGASREGGNLSRVLEVALKQNLLMQGNRRALPMDTSRGPDALIRVDSTKAI